jgi:hypothetical protein
VVALVEGDDLPSGELLPPPRLIGVGSTVDVVDLLVSFGKVALQIFGLLFLFGLLC